MDSLRPEAGAGSGSDLSADLPADVVRSVTITRLSGNERQRQDDCVVREARLDLYVNGERLVGFVCLPCDLEAFAVGFLVTEGILGPPYEVELGLDPAGGRLDARGQFIPGSVQGIRSGKILTSGCGGGVTGRSSDDPGPCLRVNADFFIRREEISELMRRLRIEASLYQMTGGAHVAALANDRGELLQVAQDIGRHTAVDKVIGKAILARIDPAGCLLLCSGRLSSEITAKAIHTRVPVLVSRSAPTDLAVRLARRHLLTLVGFARGDRMNLYSVPERIL